MTDMRKKRELGDEADQRGSIAQREVQLALKREGLNAHEAAFDRDGWDLLLQFPTSIEATPFLDASPPAANCLLQVKSSLTSAAKVKLMLSHRQARLGLV